MLLLEKPKYHCGSILTVSSGQKSDTALHTSCDIGQFHDNDRSVKGLIQ